MNRLPGVDFVLAHYFQEPSEVAIHPLGEGNINDTFLAQTSTQRLVLQRINSAVFSKPERLIQNLQQLTQFLQVQPKPLDQRWEDSVLLPTLDGQACVRDRDRQLWRALSYIEDTLSFGQTQSLFQAAQCGLALGRFHARVSALSHTTLQTVLPGFHVLSTYLGQYDKLGPVAYSSRAVKFCAKSIDTYRNSALSLEHAAKQGGGVRPRRCGARAAPG